MPVPLPHRVTCKKDFENPEARPKELFVSLHFFFFYIPQCPVFGGLIGEQLQFLECRTSGPGRTGGARP